MIELQGLGDENGPHHNRSRLLVRFIRVRRQRGDAGRIGDREYTCRDRAAKNRKKKLELAREGRNLRAAQRLFDGEKCIRRPRWRGETQSGIANLPDFREVRWYRAGKLGLLNQKAEKWRRGVGGKKKKRSENLPARIEERARTCPRGRRGRRKPMESPEWVGESSLIREPSAKESSLLRRRCKTREMGTRMKNRGLSVYKSGARQVRTLY